jgi:hypothetical protein
MRQINFVLAILHKKSGVSTVYSALCRVYFCRDSQIFVLAWVLETETKPITRLFSNFVYQEPETLGRAPIYRELTTTSMPTDLSIYLMRVFL